MHLSSFIEKKPLNWDYGKYLTTRNLSATIVKHKEGVAMKRKRDKNFEFQLMEMRRAERAERVAALAEGRKQRAHTFADRKKVASKNACRDRRYWS